MSPKLPFVPARVVIKAIERKGFVFKRQRGSHKVYKHPDGRRTTVIEHGSKPLDRSVLRRIMRDTEIRIEDLK
ncbi:MAG: type II toxin-antitoxin system HicA family toxin [Calditrichaeota bacterium]|nr:type II toxin-antitoxin system HicA family toxin [Calditrichota bacterium]